MKDNNFVNLGKRIREKRYPRILPKKLWQKKQMLEQHTFRILKQAVPN